jgi:KaiC/GvpD/RAD55 family RecA-like ATPase
MLLDNLKLTSGGGNNRLIRKIIEQHLTKSFIKELAQYIINIEIQNNETNKTKLKLLSDILEEIKTQLIDEELDRTRRLLQELKKLLNELSSDISTDQTTFETVQENILSIEQYRKYLNNIKKKIELLNKLIQMKNEYVNKEILEDELYEQEEKIAKTLDIDDISELLGVDDDEFITRVETKIKQLNIKWTELKTILHTLQEYENMVTRISIGLETGDSITELSNQIKEYIYKTNIELTKTYAESLEDTAANRNSNKKLFERLSLIQATDEYITDELSSYINKAYNVYETGLPVIDDRIGGIEAGAVYLFAAPTNHGKTLLLIKTLYSMIKTNINQFNDKDAILFVTLEDSNIKVLNRIYAVFGNYQYRHLIQLQKNFRYISEYLKQNEPDKIDEFKNFVKNTYAFIKQNSLDKVTQGKVEIFIQDARERKNDYSVIDIITTIEQLKTLGYNIKAVFIDYIELMSSTKKYEKEYSEQGQIVIDLRNLANTYMIPVIAATQLNRAAEDLSVELTNQTIGDSYNKAKFSDYILMIRQIKTDIQSVDELTSNNDENGSSTSRGRSKKKKHPEIPEIVRRFIPISETQTKLRDLIKERYGKNTDLPNFKKLLYVNNNSTNANNINSNIPNNTITAAFNPFNRLANLQHTNDINNNIDSDDNISEEIDEIYTDSKIINELFRLVEYNIPKAKDGINIPSCSDIVKTINEKLKQQYPEIVDKIKYTSRVVYDKDLIYPRSEYMMQYPCHLTNNYMLFSKFNLRVYSIPEIPIAIYDYINSLENFKQLNDFLLSNELYQHLLTKIS